MVAISPLANEIVEETYWVNYVGKKTEPARLFDRNVASTFQLDYKGKRVTVTNLHVCRIPNKIEQSRREQEAIFEQILNELAEIFDDESFRVKKEKKKEYKPLTDKDLIGKQIFVGKYKRTILAVDDQHDLCIVEGNPNLPAFSLADSYEIGELIRLIGYPRGLERHYRKGRIIAKKNAYFGWINVNTEYLMISATTYPGNSGSPVINKYGNVVGVLFAGNVAYHTESYVVPLEYVKNFVDKHIHKVK